MNKALEALEKLRDNYESGTHLFDYKYLDIIEEELKEHKELKKIVKQQIKTIGYYENLALKNKIENDKKLKVLEIIKDHKLLNYVLKNKKCANMYHLTEREINLLKEAML